MEQIPTTEPRQPIEALKKQASGDGLPDKLSLLRQKLSQKAKQEPTLRRLARRHAFLLWLEAAEQAVAFPVWSGGEIEGFEIAASAAVAEPDAPESVDTLWLHSHSP